MIARALNLRNSLHQVDVYCLLGVPQNLAVSGNSHVTNHVSCFEQSDESIYCDSD